MEYPIIKLSFLFLLSAFFSSCEASYFSLTTFHLQRIEEEFPLFAGYVRYLLHSPKRLLITIVVGNEVVNALISITVTALFLRFFGNQGEWLAIFVTTLSLLIVGEAVPKTVGIKNSVHLAPFFAPFLMIGYIVERPVVSFLEIITTKLMKRFYRNRDRQEGITEEEFKMLIDLGHREGILEEDQRDLIHRVFELSDKPVSELMVPRVEMFCLPVSLPLEDMEREIIKIRHARIPIYGTDKDDILGILYARDILSIKLTGEHATSVTKLLKRPYYVPLEKSAGVLLRELQLRHLDVAIVVDEFGTVAGMVTMEDILKHLFIDVYDDYGIREQLWHRVDDRTIVVSGRMTLREFQEITGMEVPLSKSRTVGGYILHLFGKLPVPGETVEHRGYILQVESLIGNRIAAIRVRKKEGNG